MRRITNPLFASLFLLAVWFPASLQAQTWHSVDVGTPASAGNTTYSSPASFLLEGVGEGIGGTADSFHFAHQDRSGNFEITAKVATVSSGGSANAQAGLMFRSSLDANAPFALVAVTPSSGLHFAYRLANGGTATQIAGASATAPRWLRLARKGTTIQGYESQDGINWTEIASVTLDLGGDFHVGLAVSSRDSSKVCSASFEKVSAVSNLPQLSSDLRVWLRADAGVTAAGGTYGSVSSWADQSGNSNNATQGVSGNQPLLSSVNELNGKPALYFLAASGCFLAVANNASLNHPQASVFVVAQRFSDSTTLSGLVSKHAASTTGYYLNYQAGAPGTGNLRFFTGSSGVSAPVMWSDTKYDLLCGIFNQQTVSLFKDGQLLGTPLAKTAAITSLTANLLIGSQSPTSGPFDGAIAEVLVYGIGVSDVQRREIEAY